MGDAGDVGAAESRALAGKLLPMVSSSWITQTIYAAAELGLPDLLANGARSSAELAEALEAHAPSLQRLLRALVTLEICHERDDGRFELAPLGQLLRADHPYSVRSWTLVWGGSQLPIWGNLSQCVRTGESARTLLYGTHGFEHLERDPAQAALFNQGMVELTRLISENVVAAYDFSAARRVVDVGGGYGGLLAAILRANPAAEGMIFDLPHAVENARTYLDSVGLAGRCQLVSGSFFEEIPAGGDIYTLKSIIHDWNDERSALILATCRRAMHQQARLVLVERIMLERLEPSPEHRVMARSDLNMLVALAARERTEAEFRALLGAAGFAVSRILPIGSGFSLIEALPAA